MDKINKLKKYPTFTIEEVKDLTSSRYKAYKLLNNLIKKGFVKKIRNDLYTTVIDEKIKASKYQIACGINDSVYISHLTALEYHRAVNQNNNTVYISSPKIFRNFEFEGVNYKYMHSKTSVGVIEIENARVTNIERTIIDIIKDFKKIISLEELMNYFSLVKHLDEDKLKNYLMAYDIQMLYQKVGFLLKRSKCQLSDCFFDFCKSNIGKSKRYLVNDDADVYDKYWRLVVPEELI